MRQLLLPMFGAALLAGAVLTAFPHRAEASRYVIAYSAAGSECTWTPGNDCDHPGEQL